jgi:DNA-binding transcriptional ArsR family regulator
MQATRVLFESPELEDSCAGDISSRGFRMPERLINRLSTDFLVRWMRLAAAAHGGDILAAIVFATAYQVSTDHLPDGLVVPPDRDTSPRRPRRAITPSAIASALGQSRETVRRKVKALAGQGLLLESPEGIRVRQEALRSDAMRPTLVAMIRLVREVHPAFAAAGLPQEEPRAPQPAGLQPALVIRAANTFCLRMTETMKGPEGDVVAMLLFCALSAANTRHLAIDPAAPYSRFAPALPDAARRPVTALALAADIGLSRETTRRHLAGLVAAGACRRVRGGFIVAEQIFETPQTRIMRARIAADARQFMASLVGTGLFLHEATWAP